MRQLRLRPSQHCVPNSVMPKGVEHIGFAASIVDAVARADLSDAERR